MLKHIFETNNAMIERFLELVDNVRQLESRRRELEETRDRIQREKDEAMARIRALEVEREREGH